MVKNPPDDMGDVRDVGSIPGLGRSPGEGHGNPLQYSCLYSASDMQTTPPLRQKAEELSSLLMKEETEKAGLKLNIQKTKIMTSGPITSWQIHGETMEIVRDYFLVSKITANGDCTMKLEDACSFEGKL